MAGGSIKGITIQFNGDTTQLDKALRQINNSTRSLDKELRQVDNALKFNPTNVELWRQKQELLTQKVEETKTKLDALKQAQAQMDADGVDKNSKEYRELERQIIVTENQVKNFEGQLRKVGNVNLKAASEQFKEIGSSLESAGQKMQGISTAAAVVVGSLGAMSYKAATAADDLNTLSKVTGIGTEDLQKYSYAADLVDVSVDAIAKSNKKLTRNAYEAANGSTAQAEAFEALGVSVTDSDGNLRDSEAIFQDVIGALGQMSNETERDALAQKLLGKSASELNPLIEDGGETYKMVADTMKKYDLDYVDQETLDKANEFNDSIDTMKLLGSVAFAQVGSQLSAYLAPALEKVVDLVGRFANWLSNLSPKTLTVIATIAAVVAGLAPLLIGLGKLSFAISSIMNLASTLGPIIGGLAGPIGIAIAVIAGLVAAGVLLYKNWDKIKKFAKKLWKDLQKTFDSIKDAITKAWDSVKEATSRAWNAIKNAVTTAVNAVKSVISTVFNAIKAFIKSSLDNWKTIITTAWNAIKTAVTTVVNAIKTVITTVFNAIKTFIKSSLDGWKSIITTAWNTIKAAVTTAVNAVKNTITNVFNSIKTTAKNVWDAIKNYITTPIKNAKEAVATAVDGIKTKVKSTFDSVKSSVKTAWDSIKSNITSPINSAKSTVLSTIDSLKSSIKSKFDSIKTSAKNKWDGIKSAITGPIESAKDKISSVIDKIKGFFPLKLGKIFSGIQLPHFKISGGKIPWGIGGKGTPPSVNIEWYKRGGIFNSPSVIGVGEAGSEAVVPLDKFWDKLDNMSAGETVINININGSNKDPREIAEEVKRVLIRETNQRRLAWQ